MTNKTLEELIQKHKIGTPNSLYGRTDYLVMTRHDLRLLISDWLEQQKDGRPQLERVVIDEMKESL